MSSLDRYVCSYRSASFPVLALTALSLLVACEGEEPISASDYVPPGTVRDCPGAFTPKSEICWQENDGGDEPIQQNMADAEENQARLGGERCAGGIIGAPGVEGTLTVSFDTLRLGGMYAPRNCGAVWIEDSLGFYVRTLNLWAGERKMSVVAWFQSVCKMDAQIGAPDVNTSATLNKPSQHTLTWDTKDYRGAVVPDGVYTVWAQVTENEIFPEGPVFKLNFTKGAAPVTVTPPKNAPTPGFEHVILVYTPKGSAAPPATAP